MCSVTIFSYHEKLPKQMKPSLNREFKKQPSTRKLVAKANKSLQMLSIINKLGYPIIEHNADRCFFQNIEGRLNDEMKLDGWVILISSRKEYIALKFNNGVYTNERCVIADQKIIEWSSQYRFDNYYSIESLKEGIVDLDNGARFEGKILEESGIPFGFGEIYDEDGILIYKGIIINWQRFGYGVSYHDNGEIEYEGYWCDNNRCGKGIVYDRHGRFIKECNWYNGIGSDVDNYEGNGSNLSIEIKHLKLNDNCILKDWNVSLFENLESIEIGNDCFESVKIFKIEGLNELKSLKIGENSFTEKKNCFGKNESKSFHILNCKLLKSIEIGRYSFSDFGGEFELKNLPELQSIKIGPIKQDSFNFYSSSFVLSGFKNN